MLSMPCTADSLLCSLICVAVLCYYSATSGWIAGLSDSLRYSFFFFSCFSFTYGDLPAKKFSSSESSDDIGLTLGLPPLLGGEGPLFSASTSFFRVRSFFIIVISSSSGLGLVAAMSLSCSFLSLSFSYFFFSAITYSFSHLPLFRAASGLDA